MHFNFGVKNDIDNEVASHNNQDALLSSYKQVITEKYKLYSSDDLIYYNNNNCFNVVKEFNEEFDQPAVEAKCLQFSYRQFIPFIKNKVTTVLDNCTINVPRGGIYALLGSSGCGKTTLLKCILGRLLPQNGEVRVFGHRPGSSKSDIPGPGVGYMPQELALFGEFTIEETLNYFGRLHRMSPLSIQERIDFLVSLLSLPKKTRLIAELSGGQQRRVSLATALFHKPRLAILDEPTVGVDPLLRQHIWEHLSLLCHQDGLTVMITTHYIEEARQAGVVALMRGGKLIQENNPDLLMRHYKCNTLEAVFLKLCQHIDANKNYQTEVVHEPESELEFNKTIRNSSSMRQKHATSSFDCKSNNKRFKERPFIDFGLIKTLFIKNWIKLRGNRILLLMYFLPSIQLSFFCASVGKEPINLPVAVVNQEDPNIPNFSKLYLENLNKDIIIQVPYTSLTSAVESVRKGSSWFVVNLSANFTESLKTRTEEAGLSSNQTIDDSNLHIYADMSNAVIGITLFQSILKSFMTFIQNVLSMTGFNPNAVSLPIEVKEVVYGNGIEPALMEWMAPGMIIALVFFAPLALTGFAVVKERREGLLERSLVAGVRAEEVILSHFIIQTLILFVEVFFLMFTTFFVWGITNNGTLLEASAITFIQGVTGVGFGLLISSVCADEVSAMGIGSAVVFPSWMLCGVFWPVESMNQHIQKLVYFLPMTWAVESMRCILERGWNITSLPVFMGFFVSGIYILIFLFLSVIFFRILISSH